MAWQPRNAAEARRADHAEAFIGNLTHTKGRWAGKPFRLLPWQREIVRAVFGTLGPCNCREAAKALGEPWDYEVCPDHPDGVRVIRTVYAEIPKKQGKALDVETPMLTARGWSTMGQLRVGDQVHAPDGTLTEVVAVSDLVDEDTYELTFAAGQQIVAGAHHQWLVHDRHRERWRSCETEEIARTYVSDWAAGGSRYNVVVPAPLERESVELPIDPYVLGAWLGDGTAARAELTSVDEPVLASIAAAGYEPSYRYGACQGFRGLVKPLRELGVLRDKHIPERYLLASEEQRLALLQGLMDTDGSVFLTGPHRIPRCEFSNTNRRLAEDVLFLARSLGWKATLAEGRAKLNGRDIGEKFRVCWTAYGDRSPFRLDRKSARLAAAPERPTRASSNYIVDVKQIPRRLLRCIQVAHPSHCYLAGKGLVPTHNSELAAAIALYLLFADREAMGEVYGAASDTDQAGIIFGIAVAMVRANPELRKRCRIIEHTKRIVVTKGVSAGSFYRAIPADAAGSHGFNCSGVIFDEIHVQPDRELWDSLTDGTAARVQPLTFAITVAGFDQNSICWELHEKARQVIEGVVEDPSWYAAIFAADEKDDWRQPETWRKPNPSFGITVSESFYRTKANDAMVSPAYENDFKRQYLNIWVSQYSRFIPMTEWDLNKQPFDVGELQGKTCYGGLDLSSTTDLTALALAFPGPGKDAPIKIQMRFWIPGDRIAELSKRDKVNYQSWVDQGFLEATEGNVVNYASIEREVQKATLQYRLPQVAVDRLFNAEYLSQRITGFGIEVERTGMNYLDLDFPTKQMLRLLLQKRLHHAGHPILRWMADNLTVEQDAANNVKPSKAKSTQKIDGMVALILALSLALRAPESYDLLESVR